MLLLSKAISFAFNNKLNYMLTFCTLCAFKRCILKRTKNSF